ncbi:MAG: hypothetical protein VX278_01085 [Myxococcota bacterium]|nr:hypothetical protein [Myxococcota bacterium]
MIAILLFACSEPYPTSEQKIMTEGDGFFDRPWPSDLRLQNGSPDLGDWPHQGEHPLLEGFIDLGETLNGFGNNSAMFYRFESTINLDLLPSAAESVEPNANLFLLNIDPASYDYGQRIPIDWNFNEEETHWQPTNLLAVTPSSGYSLEPTRAYALVLTRDIAQRTPDFDAAFDEDASSHAHYQPLVQALESESFDPQRVAHATIFHTQNPIQELVNLSQAIEHTISKPKIDQKVRSVGAVFLGKAYEGELLVPLWQHGEKPYSNEGGAFSFEEDGTPVLYTWEKTRFTMSVPNREMPEDGWPIAIFSDGTGGSDRTFANSDSETKPAAQFSLAGFAGFSISNPLHGDRGNGASVEIYSFNPFNPAAGRTMLRQGAADQVYLANLLSAHEHTFETENGEIIKLNPNKIVYVGHSHGGEVGAMALPFMSKHLSSAVLSGTGAVIGLTLQHRRAEDFDIEALIRNALGFEDDEEISPFHPAIALAQMTMEASDPANYAPYWFKKEPWWDSKPISVYQTEGLEDEHTPPICIESLSASAGSPIVGQPLQWRPAHEIDDLFEATLPVSANIVGYDGQRITAGLRQYANEDHFVIFNSTDNATHYRTFISTSLDGLPSIQ